MQTIFDAQTELPPDGRQSEAALDIARGTTRLFASHGLVLLPEFVLANGRRADLIGLAPDGGVTTVEVKLCLADFRSDTKWADYLAYADRFYFAVNGDFPLDVLPANVGIVIADRYGAEIVRESPVAKLPAARRKALTLSVAQAACRRLMRLSDPQGPPHAIT